MIFFFKVTLIKQLIQGHCLSLLFPPVPQASQLGNTEAHPSYPSGPAFYQEPEDSWFAAEIMAGERLPWNTDMCGVKGQGFP